nr:immunoglobulin light chain junction region [Macaca mulatta]MOY15295.1 immunoglobulin light chain junction region [Macaca mulatta]MOY15487.1 immunoglobulin light chain junction region [Macaca mulatta]MOY15758.1 immunoglobulin light chain junction region [Macaca mulatta]
DYYCQSFDNSKWVF